MTEEMYPPPFVDQTSNHVAWVTTGGEPTPPEPITAPAALARAVAQLDAAAKSALSIHDMDDRTYRQIEISEAWLQLAVAMSQYRPLTPRGKDDDVDRRR